MTELAKWMKNEQGWESVPEDSPLYEFVTKAAGCDGRVFANAFRSELVLCDGSDLVLWRIGDVREHERERSDARKRDVSQPPLDLETHRVPEMVCLSCGRNLNSATRIEGEADAPEPGNVTLCLHCGHMMVFADDMSLRELNDQEAYDLAGDPTILRFQEVRGKVMASKKESD